MDAGKKKRYLLVIGLSGAGLIVDSMIPTDVATVPAPAQAAPTSLILDEAAQGLPLIPRLPFPRALRTWDGSTDIRDIFRPPQMAGDATGDGQSPNKKPNPADDEANRRAFASGHALHAVLVSGSLRVAIVDGTWVRVGEEFEECKLERISNNQAVFSCYAGLVTLVAGAADSPLLEK